MFCAYFLVSDTFVSIKIMRWEGTECLVKTKRGLSREKYKAGKRCSSKSGCYARAAYPSILNSAEHLSKSPWSASHLTMFSCLRDLRWTYEVVCFHISFSNFPIYHARFGSTKSVIAMRCHLKRTLAENKIRVLWSKNLHWRETSTDHTQIINRP
jgi:hypothetical protein